MIDPPREESKIAVQNCLKAGIKPVMITGDHKVTAVAIAKEIGIYKDGDEALNGIELSAMTDEELHERIEKISVYARVSPEDKIRIVSAWQSRGKICAMTGDGMMLLLLKKLISVLLWELQELKFQKMLLQ